VLSHLSASPVWPLAETMRSPVWIRRLTLGASVWRALDEVPGRGCWWVLARKMRAQPMEPNIKLTRITE
jgi:hypothetical protein